MGAACGRHEGDARATWGGVEQHGWQCKGGHGISMWGNARADLGAMQDDMRGS